MRPTFALVLCLAACGAPPTGTLKATLSADPALASGITTEDGWTVTFTHVVVGVTSYSAAKPDGTSAAPVAPKTRMFDLRAAATNALGESTMAVPGAYDTLSLSLAQNANPENVNVPTDVFGRAAGRPLYFEGTAVKQSTTRTFELGLASPATFDHCTPSVTLVGDGTATIDFRFHAQRLLLDDAGKLRFDVYGLADTMPTDNLVATDEVQRVQTSSLPAMQYGATTGTLYDVLVKRSLSAFGLGDSGVCTGH